MQAKKSPNPATDKEIRSILKPADEDIVMAVRKANASREDLLEALEWLEDDDFMGKAARKPLSGSARQVYDILLEDRDRLGPDEC